MLLGSGCPSLTPRAGQQAVIAKKKAPDFTLVSHTGEPVKLAALLAKGPVVITFMRGFW